MATTYRSAEETARLGRDIYEREIRGQVEDDHDGAYLAIHVESRQWGIGDSEFAALDRLRAVQPDKDGADVFLMRIGYVATASIGGGAPPRAQ